MTGSIIIGVIIVLILSITFEWTSTTVSLSAVKWTQGKQELLSAIQLLGNPKYLDPLPGGSAIWKHVGIDNTELIINDAATPVYMGMGLDIFDEIRRSDVLMNQKEFYRRMLMIHKINSGICYDAPGKRLWIKANNMQNCLLHAVNAKNMDLKPEPMQFSFASLIQDADHTPA